MMKTVYRILPLALVIVFLGSCAKMNIKDGTAAYNNLRYQDAITLLEKGLTKVEDENARRMLASAYMKTNDFQKAKENYSILNSSTGNTDTDRLNYGMSLMQTGDYQGATEVFNGILSRDPGNSVAQSLKSSCKKIADYKADSARYEVSPVMLTGVTAAYAPALSGNKMLFSGAVGKMGEQDKYSGLGFTDLYSSTNNGGTWSAPAKVEGVNSKYHDGIATISPDGNTMILTRSNYERKNRLGKNGENENEMQLYTSTKNGEGKWMEPLIMPFSDGNYMYAHPHFSADGNTLYFSSDMQGGYGGMDLYKVTMVNGAWGKPENLGGDINSPGNELFPSMRGQDSLYFSSNGQQTIGGQDILYAVKKGNGWNGPFHLPYPINTASDDFGVAFVPGTSTGYFSSDRAGNDQIYSFIENDMTFTLKGLVTQQLSGDPLEKATIIVTNLTDGTEERFETDDIGMYELKLLQGKDYTIRVEKDGFFSSNESVSTKNKSTGEDIQLNVGLLELSNPEGSTANNPGGNDNGSGNGSENGNGNQSGVPSGVDKNAPYQIPNILWDYNKWNIRTDAVPYLNYVAKLLKDNPELKVEIASHCDSRGSDFYNEQLSQKRAKAVTDYLVTKGVRRSMLTSKGYGESKLLNKCSDDVPCSEEQHQINRRTEFTVISITKN
ncbi:MAG: OmpA family protein [Cryomorphaceae bacterium]|nr:OmpA family protein [Cryomorphaceae bacterium]